MRPVLATVAAMCLFIQAASPAAEQAAERTCDVVVYGGTSAGVTAAVAAKQMGKSVIVVSPDKHLGVAERRVGRPVLRERSATCWGLASLDPSHPQIAESFSD